MAMKFEGRNLMILNAASTYGRTLLVMGLSLVSVRWVLAALGQEDFGLFAVVGVVITFLSVISTVMVNGTTRFFAHSIGQGDPDETRRWFCSAVAVQTALTLLVLTLGVPLWDGLLKWLLTIPPERLPACRWVYYFSLIGAASTFLGSPYIGMFTAKQRIFELAVWTVGRAFLAFVLAYGMLMVKGDRLILYSGGMVLLVVLGSLGQAIRGMSLFPECRLRAAYLFDVRRAKELVLFSGWIVFGISGGLARNEGMAVLLNIYFGPLANSALGIANQVARSSTNMSQSLYSAVAPEITTREGSGNRAGMISLSVRACKFAAVMGCLFTLPLVATMDFVLRVWLKNPPEHAANFCRVVLLANLIEMLTIGYMGAILAGGRIAGYQMSVGWSLIATLPVAWAMLALGMSIEWAVAAMLLTSTLCTLARVWWAKRLLAVQWRQWMMKVVLPICMSVAPAVLLIVALRLFVANPVAQPLLILLATPVATMAGFWKWGLSADEHAFVRQKIGVLVSVTLRRSVA